MVSDAGQQLILRRNSKPEAFLDPAKKPSALESVQGSSFPCASPYELQQNIFAALQQTRNHQGQLQEFLPEGELRNLINPISVAIELTKEFGRIFSAADIESYAQKICSETKEQRAGKSKIKAFRKIFALLVLTGTAASIVLFLHEDVSDLDLPLVPMQTAGTGEPCRRDEHGMPTNVPLQCFQLPQWSTLSNTFAQPKWSPVQLRNFQNFQWMMLAPFFSQGKHGDVMHYILQDHHVLPFVPSNGTLDIQSEKTGGYGKVFMVRIHPGHHNFSDPGLCSQGFAIKQQVHIEDREMFKKEIKVLKMFSGEGRGHKHIVDLLATYEQYKRLNLIFYRAHGDLFAYWGTLERSPKRSHRNIQWMAEQCQGLTEGLLKLHKHLTFPKVMDEGTGDLLRQLSGTSNVSAALTSKLHCVGCLLLSNF